MASLAQRRISVEHKDSIDSSGLAVVADKKDYTQRPEIKSPINYSSPVKAKKAPEKSAKARHDGPAPIQPRQLANDDSQQEVNFAQLRDSNSASIPHTVETVFMSHERSPKMTGMKQQHHTPRLQDMPAGMATHSVHSGAHSNY